LNLLYTTLIVAAAFWPVWLWYVVRTLDKSDEPWGLVSLATAIGFVVYSLRKKPQPPKDPDQVVRRSNRVADYLGIAILLMYVLTYHSAPGMLRAAFLVLAICTLVISKLVDAPKVGIFGLLLLSLPIVPSLNFFLGYPMRVVVSEGTCYMLRCLGMSATREGIMLATNGQLTAIDAPCSGIGMIWAELYIVMVLACVFTMNLKDALKLICLGVVLTLVANVLRTSTLILFDDVSSSDLLKSLADKEPVIHVVTGLVVFCVASAFTAMAAWALHTRATKAPRPEVNPATKVSLEMQHRTGLFSPAAFRYCLIPLCLAAALTPLVGRPTNSTVVATAPPVWPTEIDGHKVLSVEALTEENAFASDFPGYMKRFTDGMNSYFVRFVNRETRQLHPSSDCFRGMGFKIEPRPIAAELDGNVWGSFEASKGKTRYLVLERVYDSEGKSFTDVSEWYWLALTGKTHGPWFAITIAKPLPSPNL
jgi:exosortase